MKTQHQKPENNKKHTNADVKTPKTKNSSDRQQDISAEDLKKTNGGAMSGMTPVYHSDMEQAGQNDNIQGHPDTFGGSNNGYTGSNGMTGGNYIR